MTYRRRTGALDFITKNDSDEVIQKRLNETLSLAARRIRGISCHKENDI